MVDMHAKIHTERLAFMQRNQKKLRKMTATNFEIP